jgi:hypothetical protein
VIGVAKLERREREADEQLGPRWMVCPLGVVEELGLRVETRSRDAGLAL